jgi:soluble P-type ATPase
MGKFIKFTLCSGGKIFLSASHIESIQPLGQGIVLIITQSGEAHKIVDTENEVKGLTK